MLFEIDGSRSAIFWDSKDLMSCDRKRDRANELLLKDPSLVSEEARKIISFPGGHNEGFPDTSKQLFREIYQCILEGKRGDFSFPTFTDGLREVVLCEAILRSAKEGKWIRVN